MAYRLPGGRVTVSGSFPVELEPIGAWPVYQQAVSLTAAFFAATGPAAEFDALNALYGFFCVEAQPTWEVVDHRGVISATPSGMLRLPVPMALEVIEAWAEEFTVVKESAVDKLIPPGELRDDLNRRLKAVA